jgi:hypothetical protein
MTSPKLFMMLLGCRPKGRHTEQHDIFFSIGNSLSDLVQSINEFWPEVKGNIHIDAWREVTHVDGYKISVIPRGDSHQKNEKHLFFLNLGGYKENEFEEYHYKILSVAKSLDEAKARSKETAFYKHTGFKGAVSHIDDRYGVDTDDAFEVIDILPASVKEKFELTISADLTGENDSLRLGYLPLFKIPK